MHILQIYVHICARYEVAMIKAITGTAVHRQWQWQWQQHMMDKSWLHRLTGMYVKWAKNYWPFSNLSYLGKLTERAGCNQIVKFALWTGNIENNQSAYRVGQSTESALLKVKSDLLDNQE